MRQTSILFSALLLLSTYTQAFGQENTIGTKFAIDSTTLIAPAYEIAKNIGSRVKVENQNFNKGFITSPVELLTGKVAGLSISSLSGKPGTDFATNLHGNFTLYGNCSPLIIIDGIPQLNWPISLNPNDIESITLLKDGAATGLYYEASNGALAISTKRGTKDLRIEFSSNIALSYVAKKVEVYNGDEFRNLINQRYAGNSAVLDALGNSNTNWQDEIYQNAISQDHFLSVSGTTKLGISKFISLPFRISLGKTAQEGVLKTSKLNRKTADVTLDPSFFNNHLLFNLNFKSSTTNNRIADEQAIENAIFFDPTQPVKNDSGYFEWLNANGNNIGPNNPLALLDFQHKTETTDHLSTNLKAEYKLHFIPELSIVASYARNEYTNNRKEFSDPSASWQTNAHGRQNTMYQSNTNKYWDVALRYTKHFKAISSKLSLIVGESDNKIDMVESYRTTTINNYYSSGSYNHSKGALKAKFGAATIDIKERYYAGFNGHESPFQSKVDNNHINWSAGLAWRIKNEPFLFENKFITDLKLRVSYGESDRGFITQPKIYPPLTYIENSNGNGSIFNLIANPETIKTFTIGLDYGFTNNKITGTLEIYNKKGADMVLEHVLPDHGWLQSSNEHYLMNSAEMTTSGIDLSLNASIISNINWNWIATTNLNYSKTTVNSLGFGATAIEAGSITGSWSGPNIQVQKPGNSPNSFYVYPQQYDNSGIPIEATIQFGNKRIYKKPTPDLIMGLSSKLNYKKWEFSFSSRLSLGNYVYNNVGSKSYYEPYNNGGVISNLSKSIEKTNFNEQQMHSDFYVENASFFKMDYMSLGYQFDKIVNKKVGINLSTTLQNAFVITGYSGQDPEVVGGIDYCGYPRPRTLSMKISLTF